MSSDTVKRDRKPNEVRSEIERLLASNVDDAELRDSLEELSQAQAFSGFTWLWGPELYRRNRVLFRPFILSHFGRFDHKWNVVKWEGGTGKKLDAWLREVDAADDVDLFQKLYPWKHATGQWGGLNESQWTDDLKERFLEVESPAQRHIVLRKFDLWGRLDEETALAIYDRDPDAAAAFILKHLQNDWGKSRFLYKKLFEAARRRGHEDFAYKVYRRQVAQDVWESEILQLAADISDLHRLCAELNQRHPEGWDIKLGMSIYRLVEARGRDVLPYVQKHLRTVYRSWWGGRDGYPQLVKLASRKEWWDLWSALVRTCSRPEEFNAEVISLLKDSKSHEETIRSRLLRLTGVSREWNFGPFGLAQVQVLDDSTAVAMYRRFPDLLRGPFKVNVASGWHGRFPQLTDVVIEANDEVLIDFLASRAVTRFTSRWGFGEEHTIIAEQFSRYYEALRDDEAEYARRAVNVLGQVPAYTIYDYRQLIRTNRLARMFYEWKPESYLRYSNGVRDLLEAAEIHSQAVAFRVLGLDCDEARQLASENIDLLQATLLRPLHRKTRHLAFRALQNAAHNLDTAQLVHERARETLRLPDKRYPKEQLIGMIGQLLKWWPELRSQSEQPVIYSAPP